MAFLSAATLFLTCGVVSGDSPISWQTTLLEHAVESAMSVTLNKYAAQHPDLVLSVAVKLGSHEISLASGKVSGRSVTPQDTFLYGSGTKPITAAAILRLIDEGKVNATDKVSAIVNPYLKARGKPPLAHFLGKPIDNATLLQLIRMEAGIRDYEDSYVFDQQTLREGSVFWDIPFDAMNFSVSATNLEAGAKAYKGSVGKGPLYCEPGTCSAYSSTSYQVAGLVLVAVMEPEKEWYEFDLGSALFSNRSEYPSMTFPPMGPDVDPHVADLSKYLTVPGSTAAKTWPQATIHKQNPSILGWTCGNMVASPKDVAKFYYNLLHGSDAHAPLISDKSRDEMTRFKKLSAGWCADEMKYGAGMMKIVYGKHPFQHVIGHEGDTFGFLSSQGYVPLLGASYSVVANVDISGPTEHLTGRLLRILHRSIHTNETGLSPSALPSDELDDRLFHSDRRGHSEIIV